MNLIQKSEIVDDNRKNADEEEEEEDRNCILSHILHLQLSLSNLFESQKTNIKHLLVILLSCAFVVYFGFAMAHGLDNEGNIRLLWITCLVVVSIGCSILRDRIGEQVMLRFDPVVKITKMYTVQINT